MDIEAQTVERWFAITNVNVQRLQLLPLYIDIQRVGNAMCRAADMCRAAFVMVDSEAGACPHSR